MKEVIIIGGSTEVFEIFDECNIKIKGYVNIKNLHYNEISYLGNDYSFFLKKEFINYPLIITPDLPDRREELFKLYSKNGYKFNKFIHKDSKISTSACLGEGVFIQHSSNISSNVKLSKFVRVNVMANIMHDTVIEEFSTIAPNAVLLGGVKIEKCCYIGASATVLPNISIGNNSIIGAGSVVTRDIPENSIARGNPAKIYKR